MGMKWTDAQRRVIELRNKNILVSAAAGSGKTAVLVERIIEKILDKKHPMDIDRFLIVTFTKAAAGEMRERISNAIEEALYNDPLNEHLIKQSVLVHRASICTIDSFCLDVIKNEFNSIDLDPNFRPATEDEIELLKSDVLDEVLEKEYENGDDAFINLVETIATKKDDDVLKGFILSLYNSAMSQPWPIKWLYESAAGAYSFSSVEDMMESDWIKALEEDVRKQLNEAVVCMKNCVALSEKPSMEYLKDQAIEELALVEDVVNAGDINSLIIKLEEFGFGRLTSKPRGHDAEFLDRYKGYREKARVTCKSQLERLTKNSFEDNYEMLVENKNIVMSLVSVTEKFINALKEEKLSRGILDFNDMEHYALNIFVDEKTGELRESASEYAKKYDEIMIDEYQDSNLLQEYILTAISGAAEGLKHMFMVGDVKQSIYRFRQARPELFVNKYDSFSSDKGDDIKVELDMNFRSRKNVLDFANNIFDVLMRRDIGNIDYDDKASLKYGANYNDRAGFDAEYLLVDEKDEGFNEAGYTGKAEKEGYVIAQRIRNLIDSGMLVNDREDGEKRPIEYRDIVVLFRSFGDHSVDIAKQLKENGIPVHEVSKSGYYTTTEIQTVMSLLRIIDNPMQDIPLSAVMHSYIGGFTDEELAEIKSSVESDKSFCQAVFSEEKKDIQETTNLKLKSFFNMLSDFREKAKELSVYEMINYCLTETNYLSYASAMPYGFQRRANLNLLIEKAKEYETTSYKGLFNFVRYVDMLLLNQRDSGEADTALENDNVVTFMTVHKSKGLEFPVVFLAGTGRLINKRDSSSNLLIHSDYGIAMKYVNYKRRLTTDNMLRDFVSTQIKKESLGEELRVLYVALTRAKEKMIITGTIDKAYENVKKLSEVLVDGEFSYAKRLDARHYYDLLIPAVSKLDKDAIKIVSYNDIVATEVTKAVKEAKRYDDLLEQADNGTFDEDKDFGFEYPYLEEIDRKTKYSVSTLKHRAMEEFEKEEAGKLDYAPDFSKEKTDKNGVNLGALKGTLTHKCMECFDINLLVESNDKKNDILREIERLVDSELIPEDKVSLIDIDKIEGFYNSNLAKRMAKAVLSDNLFKEKPFVMGLPAKEVEPDTDSEELVLIQGIIDAYFIENGEIVVLDYKTDKVQNEKELIGKYKTQLELYKEALSKAIGLNVSEMILYSFSLGKEISL